MTARQKSLVSDSFAAVQDVAEPLAQLFYGRLFELYPMVRPMFMGDMKVQGRKLMSTIATAIDSLDDLNNARPMLRDLGRRHADYGVQPEHYEAVMASMIWAIGQGIGLNAETRQAWRDLLGEISREMLAGAAEALPRKGPAPAQ